MNVGIYSYKKNILKKSCQCCGRNKNFNFSPMKMVLQPGGLSLRVGVGAFGLGGYSTLFMYTEISLTSLVLVYIHMKD